MGISYQAVNKWPNNLPDRIADRILGVCIRRGIAVPAEFRDVEPFAQLPSSTAPIPADIKSIDFELDRAMAEAARANLIERRIFVRRAEDRKRLGLDIGGGGQGV